MMSIESLKTVCLTLLLHEVTPSFVKTFLRRTTFEHFPFLVFFFPITRLRPVISLLISCLRSSFLAFFSSQEYCLIYHVLELASEKKKEIKLKYFEKPETFINILKNKYRISYEMFDKM